MSATSSTLAKHAEIERRCARGEFQQALDDITQMLREDPFDRTSRLYELLVRIVLHGPEGCEAEIENLRSHSDLTDQEKNLVRKILVICYDAAEREQDPSRMWSYQRLLRRLVVNQSMDAPIPRADESGPIHSKAAPITAFRDVGDRLSFLWNSSASEVRRRIFRYVERRISARPGPLVLALAIVTGLLMVYAVRGSLWQKSQDAKPQTIATPASLDLAAINDVEVRLTDLSAKLPSTDLNTAHKEKLRLFCQSKLPTLKSLYALRAQEISGLTGDMSIDLIIDDSGKVTRIFESGASLIDLGFKKTVLDEIQKWQFPGLSQGPIALTVVYEFAGKAKAEPLKPVAQSPRLAQPATGK